jgi:hypothetical protein
MHRTHKIFAIGLAAAALVGALATAGAATASVVAGWAWNGPTSTPGGKAWNGPEADNTHDMAVRAGGWIHGTSTPGGKAWNTTHVLASSMDWDSFPPAANVTALEY